MRRRVCDMKSAVDHKKKRSIVGGRLPADEQAPRASTPQRQPRQRSILEPLTRRAWRSRRRRRSAHATALSTGNRCAALNALTSDWVVTDSALQHRPKLKAQEKQEKPPVQRPASSRTPCVKTSIDGVSHTPPPTALESCVQVLLVCECSKAPLARKLRCLQPQVSCRQRSKFLKGRLCAIRVKNSALATAPINTCLLGSSDSFVQGRPSPRSRMRAVAGHSRRKHRGTLIFVCDQDLAVTRPFAGTLSERLTLRPRAARLVLARPNQLSAWRLRNRAPGIVPTTTGPRRSGCRRTAARRTWNGRAALNALTANRVVAGRARPFCHGRSRGKAENGGDQQK